MLKRLFYIVVLVAPMLLAAQPTGVPALPDAGAALENKLEEDTIRPPLPGGKKEELAAQFFINKEYDKAADLYEELYNKSPDKYYYNYLINCYLILAEFKKAEKVIAKQIKRFEGDPAYLVDLGFIYKKEGEAEKSTKIWTDVITLPKLAGKQYYIDLANAFLIRELPDWSLKSLTEGRTRTKGIYTFRAEMAEVYGILGQTENMFTEWVLWVSEEPEKRNDVKNEFSDALATDADGSKALVLKSTLLNLIQNNPDNSVAAELLIWLLMQTKDYDGAIFQAKALDKRLREDGYRLFDIGDIATNAENYDAAIKAYQYVVDKGERFGNYINAKLSLLNARYKKITTQNNYTTTDLAAIETDYKTALNDLGLNVTTADLVLNLAHIQAFYLNKTDTAQALLEKTIALPNLRDRSQAMLKLELGDIMLLKGEVWDASLLYSQVEKAYKNDVIGQEAKFRNAKLYYYKADFGWSKAQLDVLKAATSKFIANDAMDLSLFISNNTGLDSIFTPLEMFARADLFYFQNRFGDCLMVLDSIADTFKEHEISDDILYRKANIAYRKGNFASAVVYYNDIVEQYGGDILGDDALFKLASIYQFNLGDNPKAMEQYEKLMKDYPGSIYVVEARKRFRKLRGDNVN